LLPEITFNVEKQSIFLQLFSTLKKVFKRKKTIAKSINRSNQILKEFKFGPFQRFKYLSLIVFENESNPDSI